MFSVDLTSGRVFLIFAYLLIVSIGFLSTIKLPSEQVTGSQTVLGPSPIQNQ